MSTPAIHADGLSKSYGAVRALRGLDLIVASGEVVGYLGVGAAAVIAGGAAFRRRDGAPRPRCGTAAATPCRRAGTTSARW
jgi:hypothetical protein